MLGLERHQAYRLVFAESDLLPGLIIDYYANWLVLQALTAGVDRLKHRLADFLFSELKVLGIIERSDVPSRQVEGLKPTCGRLSGLVPEGLVEIGEGDFRFLVDIFKGQKTGFFLDQRFNRQLVSAYAQGRDVLECFSYTNAFSVYAAKAGAASLTWVESSDEARSLGISNFQYNGIDPGNGQSFPGDVFQVLRSFRDQGRSFDLIILDPPKFAPTKAQAFKAARGYKDINLLAMKLLRPEGLLATFSCSQGVDEDLFQKIIFGAGQDAGRMVRILHRLTQGPDHPVLLSFPESFYLKGLICQVS
ncbi:MAG: class I SAM-dependent rRNA methyltransferase [Syntrophales bacterium LBB04]|nr:class I SAM-dependent rRNA methyltransferase [Syntrophales bacterium LBB04]